MDILKNFVENLNDLILDNKTEIQDMIANSGISKSNIYAYIGGYYLPNATNLIKLADYFECSMDFLLGITDETKCIISKVRSNFIKRINLLITSNFSSVQAFLTKSKFSKSTYYSWLKRNSAPSIELVVQIAEFFGVSIDYLLGRSDY